MVAPDGARDARPRLAHTEDSLDAVSLEGMAAVRVHHHGTHAEHWEGGGAGLHGRAAGQVGDEVSARLGLPKGVYHRAAPLAHLEGGGKGRRITVLDSYLASVMNRGTLNHPDRLVMKSPPVSVCHCGRLRSAADPPR